MAIDLHLHSTASDGSDNPGDLVRRAVEFGLTSMALTDHDTQEGLAEAELAAGRVDIELIPGVELSLEFDGGGMHLLVLWLEPGPGPLQDRLEVLRHGRNRRNAGIVEALNDAGLELSLDEVVARSGGGSVGRPHVAAVMVDKGYVPDMASAFDEWLGRGKPGYVERERLTPADALTLARQSGAVPILAHPHTLGITGARAMSDLLTDLRRHGLVGLEAIYSSYRQHERDGYVDLARRFDLVPSGGSDYHGTFKQGLDLGSGYGDLLVPDRLLDELRQHRM